MFFVDIFSRVFLFNGEVFEVVYELEEIDYKVFFFVSGV